MNTRKSRLMHGGMMVAIGLLLMINPFGLVAIINFIIGAVIISSGLMTLVPAIQLSAPIEQKIFSGLGGAALVLLGIIVCFNPSILLIVISISFLFKAINGLVSAFKLPNYEAHRKQVMLISIINLIFATFIFFNINAAISSVIFLIGLFIAISGMVDVIHEYRIKN